MEEERRTSQTASVCAATPAYGAPPSATSFTSLFTRLSTANEGGSSATEVANQKTVKVDISETNSKTKESTLAEVNCLEVMWFRNYAESNELKRHATFSHEAIFIDRLIKPKVCKLILLKDMYRGRKWLCISYNFRNFSILHNLIKFIFDKKKCHQNRPGKRTIL